PSAAGPAMAGGQPAGEHGYEDVLESLADYLKENGPFDGLCGFDMGGCLAFDAARLAQEGDPRFEEKFRYLILFSTRGHREMAKLSQGSFRPKAPLQLPTFLCWSQEDDSKQYSNYEDLALYIHPNYRQI
ncbi:OVCA2, partial [Symbiodinium pilosum]